MANKRTRRLWPFIVIPALVILLLGGYALSAGGRAKLQRWLGGEETAEPFEKGKEPEPENPEESDGEDPAVEPFNPGGDKTEEKDIKEQPPADEPEKTPIIYVGQRLTIPGKSAGSAPSTASSQVITGGQLASSSGNKEIALTFDSGWEYTHCLPLLKVLDDYNVKATFFPRADWLKDHPDLGREIVRRGHTMGNHSKTHPEMTENKMSAAGIREEMRQSTRIIEEICGVRPYLFRPPYGAYDSRLLKILAEEGYPYTIMWSIDTIAGTPGIRKVDEGNAHRRRLHRQLGSKNEAKKNNGIVLMHSGGDSAGHPRRALPRIIEGLNSQGYSFTTVDKMLPAPDSGGQTVYTVQKGDTLYSISRRYGVTVQQLIEANNLQ